MVPFRKLLVSGLAVTLTAGACAAWAGKGKGLKGLLPREHVTVVHQDYDLQADQDVKVRRQDPPVVYDDKGKVRKPTEAELKEFKGPDRKLPGYSADWADMKNGQKVKVYLSKKKEDTKSKDESTSVEQSKDTDKPSWTKVGELVGQVKHLDTTKKKFTLRVEVPTLQAGKRAGRTTTASQDGLDKVYATMIVILPSDKEESASK